MICCKIIADYNNTAGSLNELCRLLSKKGDWTWNGDALFFADTEGEVEEKTVVRYVKKAGYTKVFVDVYDKNNEPHENESIKGWIIDKVTKIYYVQYTKENQKVLLETKKGLDEINRELDNMIIDLKERAHDKKNKKSKKTEDIK